MTTVTWDGIARGYVPPEPLRIYPGLALHDAASGELCGLITARRVDHEVAPAADKW